MDRIRAGRPTGFWADYDLNSNAEKMNNSNDDNKKIKKIGIIPHIGMRTFKTALVVFVCLIVYYLAEALVIVTGLDALMACIAGIICLQDSMEKTFLTGLHRIFGTIVGALIGMLFLYADRFFNNMLLRISLVCIGVVVLIMIFNLLKISESIVIGCVIYLAIMLEQTKEAPYISSIHRLIDTMVGVIIAVIINRFIQNPDKRNTEQDTSEG